MPAEAPSRSIVVSWHPYRLQRGLGDHECVTGGSHNGAYTYQLNGRALTLRIVHDSCLDPIATDSGDMLGSSASLKARL